MKIATWNVNSIRQREKHVASWLERCQPDVLMLQEIKCEAPAFPALTFHGLGYQTEAVGQKSYNGVAVLSRVPFTVTHRALPGLAADDAQSRYLEIETDGLTIAGIYLPNGNSGGEAGFAYKLAWLDRLAERAEALLDDDMPLVITGDFNVCPAEEDARAWRHLADRRSGATGKPRALSASALAWPDRRGPRGASARCGLHVLGLSGRRLATRQRAADRPRATVAHARGTSGFRCTRPAGTRRAPAVRSRPGGHRVALRPALSASAPGPRPTGGHSSASRPEHIPRGAAHHRPTDPRSRHSDGRSSNSGLAPNSSHGAAAAAPRRVAAAAPGRTGSAGVGVAAQRLRRCRAGPGRPDSNQSPHRSNLLQRHAAGCSYAWR